MALDAPDSSGCLLPWWHSLVPWPWTSPLLHPFNSTAILYWLSFKNITFVLATTARPISGPGHSLQLQPHLPNKPLNTSTWTAVEVVGTTLPNPPKLLWQRDPISGQRPLHPLDCLSQESHLGLLYWANHPVGSIFTTHQNPARPTTCMGLLLCSSHTCPLDLLKCTRTSPIHSSPTPSAHQPPGFEPQVSPNCEHLDPTGFLHGTIAPICDIRIYFLSLAFQHPLLDHKCQVGRAFYLLVSCRNWSSVNICWRKWWDFMKWRWKGPC